MHTTHTAQAIKEEPLLPCIAGVIAAEAAGVAAAAEVAAAAAAGVAGAEAPFPLTAFFFGLLLV